MNEDSEKLLGETRQRYTIEDWLIPRILTTLCENETRLRPDIFSENWKFDSSDEDSCKSRGGDATHGGESNAQTTGYEESMLWFWYIGLGHEDQRNNMYAALDPKRKQDVHRRAGKGVLRRDTGIVPYNSKSNCHEQKHERLGSEAHFYRPFGTGFSNRIHAGKLYKGRRIRGDDM
ncbi:hypothetical protein BD410DRAFT_807652 [Rickenella mellea]|uniref:Uncharacterized protein n=1 Tax=Rickenella mellea TaxID=50990 RepID=A0A4Y7PPW2_9AGAM|nr:hypothetical protein BD410DRAFT_807652 [Rickenella mellea]